MADFTQFDYVRWRNISQKIELHTWQQCPKDGNDANDWWKKQFDNYQFLTNVPKIEKYIEVGCGPYARNTTYILEKITPTTIYLNDPLLNEYIQGQYLVQKLISEKHAIPVNLPLEQITDQKEIMVDCVVCINVLDHVYSLDKCLEAMWKILNPKGLLILGQELTNAEDQAKTQFLSFDYAHPIRFDYPYIEKYLQQFKPLYSKILKREEGRVPDCHCGTLLFCGEKI